MRRYTVAAAVGLLAGVGEAVSGLVGSALARALLGLPVQACPTTLARATAALAFLAVLAAWLSASGAVLCRLRLLDRSSARGAVVGGMVGATLLMIAVRQPAVRGLARDLAPVYPAQVMYGQLILAFGTVCVGATVGLRVGGMRRGSDASRSWRRRKSDLFL